MKIFALADLHLSVSCPQKDMAVFGQSWHGYMQRLSDNWISTVGPYDWVLVAGDICWAMRESQALEDLEWLAKLPGQKVIIRGNHDYWWPSKAKLKRMLPKGIYSAQGELVEISSSIAVTGTRLWDSPEYHFDSIIDWKPNPVATNTGTCEKEDSLAIFERELHRLQLALELFQPQHLQRIVMLHYPPVGLDLAPSHTSALLEKYRVQICTFGHLHSLLPESASFGKARGVEYVFTACDYLNFTPKLLMEV